MSEQEFEYQSVEHVYNTVNMFLKRNGIKVSHKAIIEEKEHNSTYKSYLIHVLNVLWIIEDDEKFLDLIYFYNMYKPIDMVTWRAKTHEYESEVVFAEEIKAIAKDYVYILERLQDDEFDITNFDEDLINDFLID